MPCSCGRESAHRARPRVQLLCGVAASRVRSRECADRLRSLPSRAVVPSAGRTDRVNDWSAADFRAALRSLPGPVGTAPAVLLEHAPCAPLRCGCTVQPPASDIARLFAQVGERLGASSGRRASLAQRWRGQEPRRGTCCCEHQRPVHGGRYERFASLDGRLERGRPHGRGTSLPRQQRQRGW